MFTPHTSLQRTLPMLTLLALLPTCGMADGGFFGKGRFQAAPVSSPGQKAVIVRAGPSHEILLLQTTYRGASTDFAWVVPVPGLPQREDVFLANPGVLDELDQLTGPVTRTQLRNPLEVDRSPRFGAMSPGMPGGTAGLPGMQTPQVVVHERMDLGDYDVSVLSATGRGVLVDWLNRNGYAFPKAAESIAEDYVARGWTFVALRVRPQIQRTETLLTEVAPIGLRFPTKDLVYPLSISKVSAPATTAILLLVLDNFGVSSKELPTVTLPAEVKAKPGTTYHSLARDLLAQHRGDALLCESRTSIATPGNRSDRLMKTSLSKEGREMLIPKGLTATRFWAELPRESMRDLTFAPTGGPSFSLEITRTADLPLSAWAHIFGTRSARVVWTVLAYVVMLMAMWPWSGVNVEDKAWIPIRRTCLGSILALASVVFVLLIPVWRVHAGPLHPHWVADQLGFPALSTSQDAMVFSQGLLLLWIVPAFFTVRYLQRNGPSGLVGLSVPWFLLLMGVAVALTPVVWDDPVTHLELGVVGAVFAVLSLLSLAMVLWPFAVAIAWSCQVQDRSAAVANAVCWSVLALVVLIPLVGRLCNRAIGGIPSAYAVMEQQDEAATRVKTALRMFREATGAYPIQLADLTSPRLPSRGLDVSGNAVELVGHPQMPMLPELPVDPLTGRNDTWVYDPRSPNLVESGGYEVTVTTRFGGPSGWAPSPRI